MDSLSEDPRIYEYNAIPPVLVLGVPGVPGFNAFLRLRAQYPDSIFGVAPPHTPELNAPGNPWGPRLLAADPENADELAAVCEAYSIRTVVDASGWCALRSCELDPALGRRLNVGIGLNAMRIARDRGARLIRISTDLVFGGNPRSDSGAGPAATESEATGARVATGATGGYREDDPVNPVTIYGKLMAEAEAAILEGYPEAAILRIALPMGPSLNGHAGAIDWIESRFRKGRPATLYYDEVRSNLYVQDLTRVIAAFCANDERGIWHVGGPLPLSLYRIAQIVNRLGNYPPELLMGCLRAAAGPVPPRAGDVSMDTSRLRALLGEDAVRPWPRDPAHVPDGDDWHTRREGAFPADAVTRCLYGYGNPEAGF
jgi:dTDP-4-dehydrorhamnose reductase